MYDVVLCKFSYACAWGLWWMGMVQFSSVAQSCLIFCDPMDCSMPHFPVHHQFLELAQTHVHPVGDAIQPSRCPFLLLPSIYPSIRVFSNELVLCIRWPKYWHFSFSVSPSNEYSELISFRIDWLDLLAVQGTLKSLLLHHSSKASILQCSAFSTVQLSLPSMTTRKTIALTRWNFVGKVMFLLFNMLSRLVIAFLPRSKRLLISWLQSPSAMILEPKKIKSVNVSITPPSSCHEMWMVRDCESACFLVDLGKWKGSSRVDHGWSRDMDFTGKYFLATSYQLELFELV